MQVDGSGCGALDELYTAARANDLEAVHRTWPTVEPTLDDPTGDRLQDAVAAEAMDDVEAPTAALLFDDAESPTLDDWRSRLVATLLYAFGDVASFVRLFRPHSRGTGVADGAMANRDAGPSTRLSARVVNRHLNRYRRAFVAGWDTAADGSSLLVVRAARGERVRAAMAAHPDRVKHDDPGFGLAPLEVGHIEP